MISQLRTTSSFAAFSVLAALMFSACSAPTSSTQTEISGAAGTVTGSDSTAKSIKIDGSSTVYPITNAAVESFKQANPGADIDLAFSGTSGGFRKFCAGETQISNASRPISTEEIETCRQAGVRFVELPIAFDALTVVIHPQNDWATNLTVAELKQIWQPAAQGQIKNWQQVRPTFPDRPLTLYGAGGDSGTYDYFAEAIVGENNTRGDYTASEDDNVLVQGVSNDPNALGFFGFSYYEENQDKLKAIAIDDSQGKGAVTPSREAVEKAQYQPLSRPLFLYVNLKASQENEALRSFVEYYLKNAEQFVTQVDYIPLPREAYEINQVHLYQGAVGTAYEGKPQPYLTIREVLQKEQTF